jgi:ATP-dependent Lon protease
MEFGTGAMDTLVPMLEELLKEYNLRTSVKKKIKCLIKEISIMQTALVKVSDVPLVQLDPTDKSLASELRELTYYIYDRLDSMVPIQGVEPTNHNINHFFKRTPSKITKFSWRHEISSNIKNMLVKVTKMKKKYHRYKIEAIGANLATAKVHPSFQAKHNKVFRPVGIGEAVDELTHMLSDGDNKLKTVCVVGSAGLGKTTLAKAVYDKLNKKFDCGGFVSLGGIPDRKKFLRDILHELDRKRYMSITSLEMDETKLMDELKGFIRDRRYALTCPTLINAYFVCKLYWLATLVVLYIYL